MLETVSVELDLNLDRPFYTPTEVAAIAHVSPSTVHNYITEGRLASVKLSERVIRIPRRSILRLLAPDAVEPPVRVSRDEIPLDRD
jgi:hypothetical protein